MQLPVDVKALIDEATNIKAARETEIAVSVYVDETAPADLVAHVRGAFASTQPTVRFALSYLDGNFIPQPTDDIAVVVAGASAKAGPAAAALRAVGVPVMVVTTLPEAMGEAARAAGAAIPDGDIVSPRGACESLPEPVALDDEAARALDDRMGRWIVSVCHEKRLAFAIAFPFARRPLARDAVQATSLQNAGIGLVPLIPGADLPIMTLNQAKMVLQIAAAYGHEMDKDRVKELAAVVGSAYLCRTLARELAEFVPVLGFAIRTGVAYGGTSALGYAVIEYFEGGENVAGVAHVATRAAQGGAGLVGKVREQAPNLVPNLRAAIDEHAPAVRAKADELFPKVVDFAADVVSKAVGK